MLMDQLNCWAFKLMQQLTLVCTSCVSSYFTNAMFLPAVTTAYTSHFVGNSGGPAFNDQGECIGVAFQVTN